MYECVSTFFSLNMSPFVDNALVSPCSIVIMEVNLEFACS